MQMELDTQNHVMISLPAGAVLASERAAIQARVESSEVMRRAMSDGLRTWCCR